MNHPVSGLAPGSQEGAGEGAQFGRPRFTREWIRLDRTQYQHVLRLVTPLIEKLGTNMRQPVSAGEQLMLTLRCLATVVSYSVLDTNYTRRMLSLKS
ncbi:hypothetical protein E2C01_099663 [Portunus trituberculatus]|uniref:Uncharacterized protein n=1 Tax=Portunus trituberculatus TaxID=210409 RepID=A0A5B7KFI0_PORTR|nr:hypothetical protein [Portunus trituberculatus]